MFVWQAHEGAVTSLAFGPGGRLLVSAGADECVKVWDPFTGAEQFAISLRPEGRIVSPNILYKTLTRLVVARDGTRAVLVQHQRGLVFLDLIREEVALVRTFDEVLAVKPAPDGESVFALPLNPVALHQFRFADGELLRSLPGPTWPVHPAWPVRIQSVGVSPDGSRVAIGHLVYHWPPTSPHPRYTSVRLKNTTPDDLAFSADMHHLFALVGGKVMVYSLDTTLLKAKLKGHNGRITAMALAPDGRCLWTASRDATVKCWDTFALTLDRTFRFDTGGLDCLAVSPDGNVAAVGSGQKGTITVWDLG